MKNILKLEIEKALKNKFFIFAIFLGFLVTFLSFLYNYEMYSNMLSNTAYNENAFDIEYNSFIGMTTLYNSWVGGEAYTLGSTIYFFIFPILISIPYAWSYCSELKSGYIKNSIIRCGKMQYFTSKYIALFISGGLTMLIPLVMNFLLTAAFIPAYQPQVNFMPYYGIFSNTFLSEIFYIHPNIYICIYMLLNFVFCGLLVCLSCTISNIIRNRVVAVLFPFALTLGLHYIAEIYKHDHFLEISPMYFLRPCPAKCSTTINVILIQIIILVLITFVPMLIRGKRHEIY